MRTPSIPADCLAQVHQALFVGNRVGSATPEVARAQGWVVEIPDRLNSAAMEPDC